jgi:hypothetical protein
MAAFPAEEAVPPAAVAESGPVIRKPYEMLPLIMRDVAFLTGMKRVRLAPDMTDRCRPILSQCSRLQHLNPHAYEICGNRSTGRIWPVRKVAGVRKGRASPTRNLLPPGAFVVGAPVLTVRSVELLARRLLAAPELGYTQTMSLASTQRIRCSRSGELCRSKQTSGFFHDAKSCVITAQGVGLLTPRATLLAYWLPSILRQSCRRRCQPFLKYFIRCQGISRN